MDKDLVIRAKNGDPTAREKLLMIFDGMIRSIARKYANTLGGAEAFEDLLQVGRIGFLESTSRFDFSIAPAYIPYVKQGVKIAIREYLNSSMRLIRMPKSAIEQAKTLSRAYDELYAEGKEQPDRTMLMKRTGLSARALENAERNRKLQMPMSLDYSYGQGDEDDITLSSSIASDLIVECEVETGIMISRLSETMVSLPEEDRFIINSLYGTFGAKKLCAKDIAKKLSLSESAVRRRARIIENNLYRMIS